jgi:hypothetical protein
LLHKKGPTWYFGASNTTNYLGGQMSFRSTLSQMWFNIQHTLLPFLEENNGELSERNKQIVSVLELVRIENFLPDYRFFNGRPSKNRARMARAFIAKMVLKLPYTKQLVEFLERDKQLRVICGWNNESSLPHESTFSRAFAEFARTALPDRVHQALVREIYKNEIIGHIGIDSTPLIGREKPLKKEGTRQERKKAANKRYLREKKGIEIGRKRKQMNQPLNEMIAELPSSCDMGMKRNSQGNTMVWKGYKLHAAVDDHGIAVATILTSASLNDCEACIPLMEKSNKVVKNFYDLMDSAYDVPEIKEYSRSLGHAPIIDAHARSTAQKEEQEKEAKRRRLIGFCTAEDSRYKNRFPKERFNGLFKEYFGGNNIQYKGPVKVFCHTMFGVLTCTAITLLKCLS